MNLSLHWDFFDHVAELGKPSGPADMLQLCRNAKNVGVRSLNFRVEGAGMTWVPAAGRLLFSEWNPARRLDWSNYDRIAAKIDHDTRHRAAELFRKTYEQHGDPLANAVAAATEADIQLNIYVCPYDQYWPGVAGTLVEKYPDRCIVSRDGKQRLSVLSLAYAENRAELLRYYDEILSTHDIADVIVYPGTHAWYSFPTDAEDDWFGFEQPAVEDYLVETGIDVRKDQFDIHHYYQHYGKYWTLLLRHLSDRQKERGRRLIVGMDLGPWQVYVPWAAPRLMTTWRHFNDWQQWTSWGNVDLCVGHQTNIWQYDGWPANRLPYMPGEPDRPPYRFMREVFGSRPDREFSVYSFLTLHREHASTEIAQAMNGTRLEHFDGLYVRETNDFEFHLGWDVLADCSTLRI